jgi:hypothetical protein
MNAGIRKRKIRPFRDASALMGFNKLSPMNLLNTIALYQVVPGTWCRMLFKNN